VHTCKQNAIEIKRKDEVPGIPADNLTVLDRLQVLSERVKVKVKKRRPIAMQRSLRTIRTHGLASKNIHVNTGHLELQIGPKDSPWPGEGQGRY